MVGEGTRLKLHTKAQTEITKIQRTSLPLRANACSQFLFGKFVDIFLPASFLVHHSPAVLLAALTSPWQEQIQRPSPLHPTRMRSLQLKVE